MIHHTSVQFLIIYRYLYIFDYSNFKGEYAHAGSNNIERKRIFKLIIETFIQVAASQRFACRFDALYSMIEEKRIMGLETMITISRGPP